MVRTTKEKIEIMTAYEEGKKIECKNRDCSWTEWILPQEPAWNWAECDYRIKEEPPKQRMKNIQLMEWLAKGNGIFKYKKDPYYCYPIESHSESELNEEVIENVVIRTWDSEKWQDPLYSIYKRDVLGEKED